GGGDGLLSPLRDGQQSGCHAHDLPGPLRVREQRRGGRGAVLDGAQAFLEGLAAGGRSGPLGGGRPLGCAALRDAVGALGERRGRLLVRGGETIPVVGAADGQFLGFFVFGLGGLCPGLGLLDG